MNGSGRDGLSEILLRIFGKTYLEKTDKGEFIFLQPKRIISKQTTEPMLREYAYNIAELAKDFSINSPKSSEQKSSEGFLTDLTPEQYYRLISATPYAYVMENMDRKKGGLIGRIDAFYIAIPWLNLLGLVDSEEINISNIENRIFKKDPYYEYIRYQAHLHNGNLILGYQICRREGPLSNTDIIKRIHDIANRDQCMEGFTYLIVDQHSGGDAPYDFENKASRDLVKRRGMKKLDTIYNEPHQWTFWGAPLKC